MSRFTIFLYRYFKQHPLFFYALLIISTVFFAVVGLRISFEEDITKLLPSNQIGSSEHLVFNNLKVKDKIFVLMQPRQGQADTQELAQLCDELIDSMLAHDCNRDILNVLYKLDDNLLPQAAAYLYDNMPLFLDSCDYPAIDSLFSPQALAYRMQENYNELEAATGMYAYDLIAQDPAGLRYAFKHKAATMSEAFGGNYKILSSHFFTPDSATLVAFISPNFTGFDSKTGARLVSFMEKEIQAFQQAHPHIEVLFHGAPITSAFNSRQIKHDLSLTMGISLLLACLLIWFCFQNKSTLLFLLLPVGYGTLMSLCCLNFMQGTMSLMAIGIGAIVLGVALSYCLHVITHFKYVNNPEKVLVEQTKPVILGSLTTIGAFMGLIFTDSALLRDFGLFASFALVGTTVFCLCFLPQFFNTQTNRHSQKAFLWLESFNTYPFDRKPLWVGFLVVVTIACFFTASRVGFDTDLKNIGYNNAQVQRSSNLLSEKTSKGRMNLYFAVTARCLDSALVYNQQMQQSVKQLQATQTDLSFAETSKLLLPTAVQEQRIALWNRYWTEDKKQAVAKALAQASQPYGFDQELFAPFVESINKQYQPNHLLTAELLPNEMVSNLMEYTDSTYLLFTSVQLNKANRTQICDLLTKIPHTVVIDPFYYTQDMVRILSDDFNVILGISSVFVLVVLLVSLHSILLSLLAFLPMTLSWYVVQGIMGVFGIPFNLINIIVSSFIFGVGVDYSIFILDGLLAGTRNKERLLLQHKTAILLSAIVLVVSIASLMFATHPAISSIGLITLIGMSSTVCLSYTLQPFLFRHLLKWPLFAKVVARHNDAFKPQKQ